jgi:hypothetical protein
MAFALVFWDGYGYACVALLASWLIPFDGHAALFTKVLLQLFCGLIFSDTENL